MKNFLILFCLLSTFSVTSQTMSTYVYAVKGSDTLKMDVYAPKTLKPKDSLPVLIWMHGGGFSQGSRANTSEKKLAEYATKKGFIGVSISYRLTRKNALTGFGCNCTKDDKLSTFRSAAIDFLDASNYIYQNSKKLKVDRSKIIAGGSSAGAEAVLSAVYLKEYYLKDVSKYQNLKFAGVISLSGAIINANYITKSNAIPTVMFHGIEDPLVPFATAPHHLCGVNTPGYLMLDGSSVIANKLNELEISYLLNVFKAGKHEISGIPFDRLDAVFEFIDQTVFNNQIIQTRKIIN